MGRGYANLEPRSVDRTWCFVLCRRLERSIPWPVLVRVRIDSRKVQHRPRFAQTCLQILLRPAVLRMRSGFFEVVVQGTPRQRSDAEHTIEISERDDNVSDALEHYARSDDWFDIYKVLEVIRADVGGEDALIAKAWAAGKTINLLRQTANYYRHARTPKADKPMPHGEVCDLVRALMRRWIEGKRSP